MREGDSRSTVGAGSRCAHCGRFTPASSIDVSVEDHEPSEPVFIHVLPPAKPDDVPAETAQLRVWSPKKGFDVRVQLSRRELLDLFIVLEDKCLLAEQAGRMVHDLTTGPSLRGLRR